MKTIVYFKLLPDQDTPIAFFPCSRSRSVSYDEIMCYEHVGQHSVANLDYFTECRPATPEQYAPLKNELEQLIGYDLAVLNEIL